jgi:acyl-CoA thioesterase-1
MSARFSRLIIFWLALAAGGLRAAEPRTVVFFGDSLTAGYGLDDPVAEAYPALIQEKIDAARLPWRVVNAGLSGETTAGGLRRVEWILRQPASVFVIALGANDGRRGIDPAVSQANLQGIVNRVRARQPAAQIVLVGMRMPPTMGDDYAREFATVYADIARENHLTLVPFLLAGVGDEPGLNQPDGIHPTARGHAVLAETVWRVLQPLLN